MSTALPDLVRQLLDRNAYFVLSTTGPDGAPQSSVVWAQADGDDVLVSTLRGRRKELNIRREPRVSLCAYDPENPFAYVEVRGTVSVTENGGRELIEELSRRYTGNDYPQEPAENVRVVLRITPTRVIIH